MDPTASGHFPKIWRKYQVIVEDATPGVVTRKQLDTDEFMAEARKSQVVVASGEPSFQGSVILTAGEDSRAPVQPLLQKIATVPSNKTCCDRGLECLYFSCVDAILNPKIFNTLLEEEPFSAGGQTFYYKKLSTKMPLTSSEEMSTEDPITILPTIPRIPASTPPGYIEGQWDNEDYSYTNDNGDWATILHAVHDLEAALQRQGLSVKMVRVIRVKRF